MNLQVQKLSRQKPAEFAHSSVAGWQTAQGRQLLAQMLEELYGRSDYSITYNKNGKPLVDFCWFNLSHSGEYVVCAVSENPIGVDIERLDRLKKRPHYAFFTQREDSYINAAENFEKRFYTLWTRKEAYIKALGGRLRDAAQIELVTSDLQLLPQKNGFSFETLYFEQYLISICENR